ncbi:MAG TPA: hypothetical protein PLE93_02180, partial [Solirubrobacterales bacterium]|nr:hypothetical protein [Solirubrobacterales bacterium]
MSFDVPANVAGTRNTSAFVNNPSDPYLGNNSASAPITIIASADIAVSVDQPSAMRIGDTSSITYSVRNIGTAPTTGSPSVKLVVFMPASLEPVSTNSHDGWECSAVPRSGNQNARFDCVFPSEMGPGDVTSLNARVRVLQTNDTQTDTLVGAESAGDVNQLNNTASAFSSITGIDLKATVAPVSGQEDTEAGVTSRRVVTVTNVGTAVTTGPVRVEVPLPAGVSWTPAPPVGTGWECVQLLAQTISCVQSNSLAPGASAPALNIDIQPSRTNAPSVTIPYTVSTTNDENAENNTATRTDTVLYKPETTILSAPSGTTTSRTARIEFEADDHAATFECKLDTGSFSTCASPVELNEVPLGGHTLSIRAINERGMVEETVAEANWTVITEAPVGESTGLQATLTGGTLSLAALGEVELPASQLKLRGSRFQSGAWSIPQSGFGFEPIVQVIDAPGIGEVSVKISISSTGPGVGSLPSGGGAASLNLPVQAKLEASVGGAPLIGPEADCALRPITFDLSGTYDEAGKTVSLGSPGITFPQVSAGCGSLGATVNSLLELPRSDIAMNLVFALEQIGNNAVVKPAAPAITSGPSAPVSTKAASFAFSGDLGSTFECQLDDGDWAACSSPKAYSSLAEGAHTFRVRQTSDSGQTSDPATRSWTADTTAPDAPTITAGPSGTVGFSSTSISFTGESGASFACSLDGGPFEVCVSPKAYQSLADGDRTFRVRQIDAAGNTSATSASRSWTINSDSTQSRLEATLTGGSLSLAALGEVELPADQLKLIGQRAANGTWSVPQSGVIFEPIEQTIDAPGIGSVTVKISISATADGAGSLPTGGGAATLNLPVQAKL